MQIWVPRTKFVRFWQNCTFSTFKIPKELFRKRENANEVNISMLRSIFCNDFLVKIHIFGKIYNSSYIKSRRISSKCCCQTSNLYKIHIFFFFVFSHPGFCKGKHHCYLHPGNYAKKDNSCPNGYTRQEIQTRIGIPL